MRRSGIALAGLLAAASPAGAAVTFDFTRLGDTQVLGNIDYLNCGLSVRTTPFDFSINHAGTGIAVDAGLPNAIDDFESVSFVFYDGSTPTTATAISYAATAVGAGDGDGIPAEVTIEAFDEGDTSLGVVASAGLGDQPISSAFGGVPIRRVEITAGVDPIRIQRLGYTLPEDSSVAVQVNDGPLIEGASYELCGVTFSGSNTLRIGDFRGIRVLGGAIVQPDNFIDSGETLEVALAEPVSGAGALSFHVWSSTNPQGQAGPRFDLEGFDPQGASLGVLPFEAGGAIDVSNAFFGESIAGFEIQTRPAISDALTVGIVTYLTPEPAATLSAWAVLLAISGVRAARPRNRERA